MLRITHEALTFDDVLLVPSYSEVTAKDVSLHAPLTRAIIHAHPAAVGRHGHGDRGASGHRPRPRGWHRHSSTRA